MTERFKQRKPVQIMLTDEEVAMVERAAEKNGISRPNAIRRAIAVDELMRNFRDSGIKGLELGVRNRSSREIEWSIPVELIPEF